jgi:hypothetical protein
MFFISLAVCIIGGALFGTVAWLLLAVIAEKNLMPLVSFPVVVISAMPVAIPFGTVAAVIATILFNVLSLSSWRSSGRAAWICIGSTVGLILGGIFPLFLILVGFGPDDPSWRFYWGSVGAAAGIGCGFILGWIGWREVEQGNA